MLKCVHLSSRTVRQTNHFDLRRSTFLFRRTVGFRPRPIWFRKEVIQPHLPVQLPCYDFVPVIGPAFGGRLLAVTFPTSGVTNFHDVTGGVYKPRERIQRSVLTYVY